MVSAIDSLAQIKAECNADAAFDQASLVNSSLEGSSPSLADVSLQTGQSLIENITIDQPKPAQLTKQTSTTSIPVSTACQTFESDTVPIILGSLENLQHQETIKVLKSTDGKHDVIEIATKNILPSISQERIQGEQQIIKPEDIVVDMKYQDSQKQENITSELNIQHATPQSFETVLTEPDDVTTEVVVDSDGTKRIIVRKLRRTLVTSRQTMQQHVSQLSTAVGDGPPVLQAFSEATMRGQQVTVTRTKPDGTVEMATKQTYGGKVVTGTPNDQLNVEEYESTPQISHRIIQGDIKALSPRPPDVDDTLVESANYRTNTSTVHAVVQQVTRRVIRKTRRIIRKVTIIDGKEVTSEEIVEEPEEVEIDEQGIPHISINVVKGEDQGTFESSNINPENHDPTRAQTINIETITEIPQKYVVQKSSLDAQNIEVKEPFSQSELEKLEEEKLKKSSIASKDSFQSHETYTIDKLFNLPDEKVLEAEPLSSQHIVETVQPKEKHELEYTPIEVKILESSSLAVESKKLINSEKCAVLQTPIGESIESTTKDVSSLESIDPEEIATITEASCKFEETPVRTSFETHSNLEFGTVDLVQHTDVVDRRTVDIDDHFQSAVTDIPQKVREMDTDNQKNLLEATESSLKLNIVKMLEEERKQFEFKESNITEKPISKIDEQLVKGYYQNISLQTEPPVAIQKVDISLLIQNQEDVEKGPLISVESRMERPEQNILKISEDNINIRLPAEKESVKQINNKINQTSIIRSESADKEFDVSLSLPENKKMKDSQEVIKTSEIEGLATRKNRKKKKHREKKEKDNENISDEESSESAVTTTIADSIEIDVPHSDSSKHITDQPEPDVYEKTESSDTFSAQKDEICEGDGYEADHRTTVEEMPADFEIDATKKKKKKKKKQKARILKEDVELPKSAEDEMELTDEAYNIESEETKITKKPSKKRKRKLHDSNLIGSDDAFLESDDVKMTEADTQTKIETRDVSAGEAIPQIAKEISCSAKNSSESEKINKFEQEIQTLKIDEINTGIQTSPRPGHDTALQTCLEPIANVEDCSVQTKTPDIISTEEMALQTTPREEKGPSLIPLIPLIEADTQTTATQIENVEIQTSPADSKLMTEDVEVQTSTEFLTNVEQQTTPSPNEEKILEKTAIRTETPELTGGPEKMLQTSKATSPVTIQVEDVDVQANLTQDIALYTTETQTTPTANTPTLETQEIEIQTTPEKLIEVMIQTTPVEIPELLKADEMILQPSISLSEHRTTSEMSIQTKTEEIIPTMEESIQFVPETSEISSQTTALTITNQEPNISVLPEEKTSIDDIQPHEKSPRREHDFEEEISESINTEFLSTDPVTPIIGRYPIKEQLLIKKHISKTDRDKTAEFLKHEMNIEIPNTESEEESSNEPVKLIDTDKLLVCEKQSEIVDGFKLPEKETFDSKLSLSEQDVEIKTSSLDVCSSDPSLEIEIQATVEICGSTTPDSTSQDITITEEPGQEESLTTKRQKRKRQRHKTVEIRDPQQSDDKSSLDSIFGQSTSTLEEDLTLKLSYSDAAKKNPENLISDQNYEPNKDVNVTQSKTPSGENEEGVKTVKTEELKQCVKSDIDSEKLISPHKQVAADSIEVDARSTKSPQNDIIRKTEATRIMLEKNKDSQKLPSHLSNVLHISTLESIAPGKSFQDKASEVHKDLTALKNALEEKNIIYIEETFITVVETISVWLETIESRIYLGRECPSGPSENDTQNFVELKDEVNHIEEKIKQLDQIWTEVESFYPQKEHVKIKQCLRALENQAKTIEEVATDAETHMTTELAKWSEFMNAVKDILVLTEDQKNQLDLLINSEKTTVLKLEELDKIVKQNRKNMEKISALFAEAKVLLKDYPCREIPQEINTAEEMTQTIEYTVYIEREKLLQLLALTQDYEQTLHEFAQITKIAENLLDSSISVMSLEHLQEEMQKHRKFFVNLNHCRAILESLEDDLDAETREVYSELHDDLHSKAISLLDQAASKAQQMSLAASRWVVLEQGIKEEKGWLQVAHQRVPDLQNVTSTEYEQYITLYQNLSLDIANHHDRLLQLLELARGLQELINIEDPDDCYGEALDVIIKLQENVDFSLRRLLAFRESWSNQEMLVNRLENWMSRAERELSTVNDPMGGHMRQFWELRAQYEVHNNMRNEANNCFEQALHIVPLSDEMLQRQYHAEMQKRWNNVTEKLKSIQDAVRNSISSEDIPANEKLNILERELNELRITIDEFHGVMKTEEELELYVERLSVLFERVCIIQDELGRLGMLPAAESERVGVLLSSARRLEGHIGEELDAAQLLRERLQALKRGIARIRKAHQRHALMLDQCEGSERQGSDVVAAAAERCQTIGEELGQLWQEIMGLRQLLHTLPTSMRISVSPVGVERDISALQDRHEELEARCTKLLALLRSRLLLWRRFEKQLEMVQQSVQEADYMMELLTVQGSVDYERLLKATERLEGLNGDFVAREVLISELRSAAEPLRESCAAEVSERVDAVVNEAVQAWEDTKSELGALCTKYQHAVRLWQQYRDSSAAVKAWVDTQMGSIANLPPEEALKQVKVCEDTLAEHKERLTELRGLVAQIASDVGLDAGGTLQSEVEALGRRLEDVRETLSSLADTADARALNQQNAKDDICQTKNFLDSVHQSIATAGQGESGEELRLLRNHLLGLTRAEPQLQSMKERALEVAPGRETSIVEVLQLWQRLFQETFQQYHRLSARLVRSQDVDAALRLWQEYLGHVQEFLSSSLPGDYGGLAEHRNLCEVHKNLLTDQQNLIQMVRSEEGRELSVVEQFNALTNLHNESLAQIMERHAAIGDRLAAWERYRLEQSKLLSWLKDIDRERARLQLRFIHLRRVDKILQKIEALLERLPSGESQADTLRQQQEALLASCEEALALSVRMEHAANVQRISNVRASLETWKDFVLRIKALKDRQAEQSAKITAAFQETSQLIGQIDKASPGSLAETRHRLDSLQQHKAKLVASTTDLEALGVTTEQLRECLSPSDIKSLNQQSFLLCQQHGDLEHQLALLAYRLGERCSLHSRWESRSARLLLWMQDTEDRIHNCDTANLDEPEEALKRLECEVQAEMALKQKELEWVQNNGLELVSIAESEEKLRLEKILDEVNERWSRLLTAGKARANKIVDLMQTMSTLQQRLAEIRIWLGSVETQMSEPYTIESANPATIQKKLQDHKQIQKTIEAESGNIGQVLNLCEILLNDCDAWKASFNTDVIKTGMEGLERRWKATCVKSSERKRKIILTGKLLAELETIRLEHEEWLTKVEKDMEVLERSLADLSKDNTEKTLTEAQKILEDIKAHNPALQILEQCYSRLAKGGLEPENLRSLTKQTRLLLDSWHGLMPKINTIIAALQKDQKTYREFISAHGAAVIGLTQVDVMLTQLQHLAAPDQKVSPRRRLQELSDIDTELDKRSATLRRADELALQVMHESNQDDVTSIQELVDEYQLLWKDIKERVDSLRIKIETQERQEVDEAVQVETLKFERDSAVQVDTLPKFTRMTSFDAYLIELESAISECRVALDALENAVLPEPVPGTGLSTAARAIARLIGSCQSTIELVKHLHNLLSEEENLAKACEVAELTARYEDLLTRARARENQIRELKSPLAGAYCFPCEHDGGRLTCPLCSHRNWAQLDNDLWRLEKWLEFAEGTQSEQDTPPANIEQLEDVIQDQHEFLLDLDSHKSIVVSLNIVGAHLADHTEDVERANELRDRLASANVRWDKVCQAAAKWQNALQASLMANQQFHKIIEELLIWLQRTEQTIRASEPIDLTEGSDILRAKYDKFKEMQGDLERCEPRVLSLQEAANHLLDEHVEIRERLQELRLRLQSLRRLTSMYVLKLGSALGLDPRDVGLAVTSTSLAVLSRDLLDEAASGTTQAHGTHTANADDGDQTVLARGYHFIGRVLRASLPIQALMLLLLGAASLVPSAEEDYSCMLSNNLARSFTPLVQYPNGPPPL